MLRKEYAGLPIFDGLDAQQFQVISPFLEEVKHPADCVIFEQGQVADSLYILLEGEVQVRYKPYDGPPLSVARILPGGVFGWSAALGRDIYTSAAVCVLPVIAYRLRSQYLQQLCDCHPDTGGILLDRLARVIAERMRNTHPQILQILTEGVDPSGKCKPRSNKDDRLESRIFPERTPGSINRNP
jgi:CRP-like cAMP-binding protein